MALQYCHKSFRQKGFSRSKEISNLRLLRKLSISDKPVQRLIPVWFCCVRYIQAS